MFITDRMFGTIEFTPINYPNIFEVPGVFDTHLHPRDTEEENDGRAEMNIPKFAEVYEGGVGIGNTTVPLTTSLLARQKGAQWRRLIPGGSNFKLHVAGLITEATNPDDVVAGYDKPDGEEDWLIMKMFIRAASNSNNADVDDMSKIIPVLKAMTHTRFRHKKRPMLLSIHAERKFTQNGQRIIFLGRERAAVERDLPYLFSQVPEAHINICHVSDATTIDVIRHLRSKGHNIWGEICPHYAQYTCDDLFEGPGGGTALNTDLFCLPIFKTETDRRAAEGAMVSGEEWCIYGSDNACHWHKPTEQKNVKTNDAGITVGGQAQDPMANISFVIERAIEAGRPESVAGYLSHHGREAVGLPRSENFVRFRRWDWKVSKTFTYHSENIEIGKRVAHVAAGGQDRKYIYEKTAT